MGTRTPPYYRQALLLPRDRLWKHGQLGPRADLPTFPQPRLLLPNWPSLLCLLHTRLSRRCLNEHRQIVIGVTGKNREMGTGHEPSAHSLLAMSQDVATEIFVGENLRHAVPHVVGVHHKGLPLHGWGSERHVLEN